MATTNPPKRREKSKKVTETGEPEGDSVSVAKRRRLDEGEDAEYPFSLKQEELTAEQKKSPKQQLVTHVKTATSAEKRLQFVVGLKEVTKALEKGTLRAVVVCLSAKPPLLLQHIQILTATRGVPTIALHGVSDAIAPVLGLKSALIIGLKVRKYKMSCGPILCLYTL